MMSFIMTYPGWCWSGMWGLMKYMHLSATGGRCGVYTRRARTYPSVIRISQFPIWIVPKFGPPLRQMKSWAHEERVELPRRTKTNRATIPIFAYQQTLYFHFNTFNYCCVISLLLRPVEIKYHLRFIFVNIQKFTLELIDVRIMQIFDSIGHKFQF